MGEGVVRLSHHFRVGRPRRGIDKSIHFVVILRNKMLLLLLILLLRCSYLLSFVGLTLFKEIALAEGTSHLGKVIDRGQLSEVMIASMAVECPLSPAIIL